ncbi:MAG: PEP-CTERM sorting domain-containing protein [Steroidobacter sp.]
MRKVGLWAVCAGLLWSTVASAVPVYYTYGYFGDGSSYDNGDAPSFRFTMEYDLDRQPTYMNFNGDLVTQADLGLHSDPAGPWYGYYHLNYFHATLVGTSEWLDFDLSGPNHSTSFRQISGPPGPTPSAYEDVVRWESGSDYYIQLIRFPGILDAPIGSYFPFVADINLGPTMACNAPCGQNLHLLAVSDTHSIPEPATLGLLLLGAGLAVGVKRRRARES